MSRKITIVSATEKEITPLIKYLQRHAAQHTFQTWQLHGLSVDILYTGIGILQSAYSLMEYLSHRRPDAWIQAGIGGAFDPSLPIGGVFQIQTEKFISVGAEDRDGRILDPFELGWENPDAIPYAGGLLINPHRAAMDLPIASGMTVFHAHGSAASIDELRSQSHGQIENMEGGVFFYISLLRKIPFISLRSISNLVAPRDTSTWNFDMAITNVNEYLIQLIEYAEFYPDRLFGRGS